ncbi:MAG: type IV secretion system DNA-binding domain-containing protein [Desulfobacterales bacterium]|nr:type IV secretion system DNA-binding domain-containing protein [Desulfobacterales bacterium]
MKSHFPAVHVTRDGAMHEAMAGLAMRSILKADLLDKPGDGADRHGASEQVKKQQFLQARRESLLHSLSGLGPGITLELHFDARPDLANIAKSCFPITLFIRCKGKNVERIKEKILSFYLSLRPILASHLLEAEFVPLVEAGEMYELWQGNLLHHAASIRRRREILTLEAPLKKTAIGFEARTLPGNTPLTVHHVYPWTASFDDWSNLVNTMISQLDPVKIIVRVTPGRLPEKYRARLVETIATCDRFLGSFGEDNSTLRFQADLVRKVSLQQLAKLSETSFHMGLYLLAAQPVDHCLANILGKAVTRIQSEQSGCSLLMGGFEIRKTSVPVVQRVNYYADLEPYSLTEAACAFRLPSPPTTDIPGLSVSRSRTSLALLPDHDGQDGSVVLGINEHQGVSQKIRVGADDRMRHIAIFGQTGTGKSTLLEHLILQDIRAGRGMAVIDPHGDMVDSLVGKIPENRINDVILFDFLERQRPIGFNLLEWHTIEERDLIIDELYLTLDRLYDMRMAGGPVFESNLRGMLKLLMGDRKRKGFTPTLLEFSRCYLDRDFRLWLKESIDDPTTHDFLQELERTGGEASLANLSPYVTSKFSRFTHDSSLRRIVGQEKTAIDFEAIMNRGNILLLKLGKGRFGAEVGGLLVNQIVSRFKLAAMKRGEIRPEARKDFILYVDECHHLSPENFIELLAEARKYRLGLVLATQYTAQLTKTSTAGRDDLLAAILGNVGAIVAFRLGKDDAERLEPVFYPHFQARDIIGLPNWHGYISAGINGESIPPFSFRGIRDETLFQPKTESKIIISSMSQYGREASEVDRKIRQRRSVGK